MKLLKYSAVGIIFFSVLFIFSCQEKPKSLELHNHENHGALEEKKKHAETDTEHENEKDHVKKEEHHDGDEHETEKDHSQETELEKDGDHTESGHEGDDEHEGEIVLSEKAVELAGITIAEVTNVSIARTIELPGEIGFNEDQLAHITPRFGGVVRDIPSRLGEWVKKGDILATIESNASLTTYSVRAPIEGRIVEKHATPGEFAGEDATLLVIANLGSVWANCEVYAKDADVIKTGQAIVIKAVSSDHQIKATLSYVAPVYNETTRSMIARAVIPNKASAWRPGTFITGVISLSSDTLVPAVSKDAIQVLHDKTVVFVPEEDEENVFRAVEVTCGLSDDNVVEITAGLKPGDQYVAHGAFELKAKVVTGALGGHAGHGH